MYSDEKGYIKFICYWENNSVIKEENIHEINIYRNKLFNKGLIGVYPNSIGFGNVSIRYINNTFIITGSATGAYEQLNTSHYSLVDNFDFDKNSINCAGQVKASSESLTHAALYVFSNQINAVVHVHNIFLWNKLLNELPSTSAEVEYGTPEMAREVLRLLNNPVIKEKKIFAMAGHREGVISFGGNLSEAYEKIINYL